MIGELLFLAALLALSGFFSAAETALFSIGRTKIRHLAKQDPRFQLIEQLKADPHRLLATILIGNNLVNIAASAYATTLVMEVFPNHAVGIATGVMTLLILVFGEVTPKSIATRNNIMIARLFARPVHALMVLLYPLVLFLNFIPKITGRVHKPPSVTEEELLTMVEVVQEEGEIKEEEKELIHNIFEFDDTSASEIMTPRADMFVIELGEPLKTEEIIRSGFSRIPVIEGSIDNVVGIVNIKDLFRYQSRHCGQEMDIRRIMNRPYFVPENKKLDQLLQQFKKRKHHIAIVVDEHGGVSGLITLEDVLEQIVGEIRDETDEEEPHVVRVKSKEWRVLGKADIAEVNQKIPMEIAEGGEYDTFSGFILDRIGRIPNEQEEITVGCFVVTVKEKDGNRIVQYYVRQNEKVSA
jgi:CBS domain containing-hemolysin-like protein